MLHDSSYVRNLKQSNSQNQRTEWWLSGAGGGENGELLLNGYKVSVTQDE